MAQHKTADEWLLTYLITLSKVGKAWGEEQAKIDAIIGNQDIPDVLRALAIAGHAEVTNQMHRVILPMAEEIRAGDGYNAGLTSDEVGVIVIAYLQRPAEVNIQA